MPKIFEKKRRQGRSKETRERLKNQPKPLYSDYDQCINNCLEPNFIEDLNSGDLICTSCGFVRESGGLASTQNMILMKNISKGYEKSVHWRQRIARLSGKGPQIDQELLDIFYDKITDRDCERIFGKKIMLKICHELNLDKKLSDHWIQIRIRLELDPYPEKGIINPDIYRRINIRYFCIEMAFKEKMFAENEKTKKSFLSRKNIFSLNYIIVQTLRLESEELFDYFAPYLPQLSGFGQPELNNLRWKKIMKVCKKKYSFFSDRKTGEIIYFDWFYKEITPLDILLKFTEFF